MGHSDDPEPNEIPSGYAKYTKPQLLITSVVIEESSAVGEFYDDFNQFTLLAKSMSFFDLLSLNPIDSALEGLQFSLWNPLMEVKDARPRL